MKGYYILRNTFITVYLRGYFSFSTMDLIDDVWRSHSGSLAGSALGDLVFLLVLNRHLELVEDLLRL